MAFANANKPVLDLPVWEILEPFPVAGTTGSCFCMDLRGSGRFAYAICGTNSFWRYDLQANVFQQLANPPAGTFGLAVNMVFDPSQGNAGRIWALVGAATSTLTFSYYDVAGGTWTARSITNLPATATGDWFLCHPCASYSTAGTGGVDDAIFAVGNNTGQMFRYAIAANTWTTAGTILATASLGTGCSLHWQPAWDTNKLLVFRGATSTTAWSYSISATTYAPNAILPVDTIQPNAYYAQRNVDTNAVYVCPSSTQRIYTYNASATTLLPQAKNYIIAPAASIGQGQRMFYAKETNGAEFLYMVVHGQTAFIRTPIFF